MKMCEDFSLNFELWWQNNSCIMTTHHLTFTFSPKTTSLSSPTHHTFLFLQLKMKLKGCHFDTTEMIEAELQAVMNTDTEQNFQGEFKSRKNVGNGGYMWKRLTSRVMMASKPKVSFRSDGSKSPGNYGYQ
jgi:hypothetical protein